VVAAAPHDQSALSTRGPDWFTDPYTLSPGDKSLLTLYGAEHPLGGIAGHAVAETTDESPDRVALIQRVTCAYLRTALDLDHTSWATARAELQKDANPLGDIQAK
jgi:hypothetical protein